SGYNWPFIKPARIGAYKRLIRWGRDSPAQAFNKQMFYQSSVYLSWPASCDAVGSALSSSTASVEISSRLCSAQSHALEGLLFGPGGQYHTGKHAGCSSPDFPQSAP